MRCNWISLVLSGNGRAISAIVYASSLLLLLPHSTLSINSVTGLVNERSYLVWWKWGRNFFSSWSISRSRIAFWSEWESLLKLALWCCIGCCSANASPNTTACDSLLGVPKSGRIWAKRQLSPSRQLPWEKKRHAVGNRFTDRGFANMNLKEEKKGKLVAQAKD